MESIYYPRLLRRVQAVFIDSAFFTALIITIAFLPTMSEWSLIKPLMLAIGVFILGPGFESWTGGTIGHHWMKIRVTRLSGHGNINIFAATIRFILKSTLGWFSFAVVMATRKHQAFHDVVARSLVVYRTSEGVPESEKLVDRRSLADDYVMPSWWKRMIFTLIYFLATYIVFAVIASALASDACVIHRQCMSMEAIALLVISVIWLLAACATIVLGWRGQLYGCRRRPRS